MMAELNHDDPVYKLLLEEDFLYSYGEEYTKLDFSIDYIEDIPESKDKKVSITSYLVQDHKYLDFVIIRMVETFTYHYFDDIEDEYMVVDLDIDDYTYIAADNENLDEKIRERFFDDLKAYCEPCEILESMEIRPPMTQIMRRLSYEWAKENCDDDTGEYLEEDVYEDIYLAEDFTEDDDEDLEELLAQSDKVETATTSLIPNKCNQCGEVFEDDEIVGNTCVYCSSMSHEVYISNMKKSQRSEKSMDMKNDDEAPHINPSDDLSYHAVEQNISDDEIEANAHENNKREVMNKVMKKCIVCGIQFNAAEIPDSDMCYDCWRVKDAYSKGEHIPTEEEVEAELQRLAKRFRDDGEFMREILEKANKSILNQEHSLLYSEAEKRLIEIVIMNKY